MLNFYRTAIKYDIVVESNKAKFSQNPDLKNFLLSTGNAILVEASPYDTIWGIGINREQAEKGGIELWHGQNLLGCALMEVRDWLTAFKLNSHLTHSILLLSDKTANDMTIQL